MPRGAEPAAPPAPGQGHGPALLALLALTAARLLVAGLAPLSPDEAYYWTWSHALAPGFPDHPPMVALWIRAGTALAGETRLGVRLLAPLSAALGSALLWRAAEDILPGRRAGVPAAALLNATLLLGVGAVTMTPDTPLLFFWCTALAAAGRLLRTGRGAWWLALGLAAGCAGESKYTALLLGAGLALWLVAVPEGRRWLRTPWPWAGGALAAAVFAPNLLWNAAHGWASLGRQGGRTADWHPARALRFEPELLAGQLALATPLVFAACVAGTWRAARAWPAPGPALLAALTLPGAAVFLEHATGDRVQANWPAILYPAAAIAAGGLVRRWRPAAALGFALAIPVYLQAAAAPFPLPRALDPTLARLGGWPGLARQVAAYAARETPAPLLAADEYGLASELTWEDAAPVVLGVEPRWASFELPRLALDDRPVLLLRSERRGDAPDPAAWADARQVATLTRERAGHLAERYRLYLATPCPGLTGAVLPRPATASPPNP